MARKSSTASSTAHLVFEAIAMRDSSVAAKLRSLCEPRDNRVLSIDQFAGEAKEIGSTPAKPRLVLAE